MEPQPSPRSTPPAETPPPPLAPPPPTGEVCPACGEPRAEGARFCEECGHDYGAAAAATPEKPLLSGPLLWVFVLFWIALAVGGLIFLYTGLWQL